MNKVSGRLPLANFADGKAKFADFLPKKKKRKEMEKEEEERNRKDKLEDESL